MMILKHIETLSYYDGVMLFKASASTGGFYICVLVEEDLKADIYLCARITEDALELFRKDEVDLLSLYQGDADDFCIIRTGDIYTGVEAKRIKRSEIPDDWFPGAG